MLAPSMVPANQYSPLGQIASRGRLTVALEENSINYFLHNARPVGYQLEMLTQFANDLNVPLYVIPVKSAEEGLRAVVEGEANIFAPAAPTNLLGYECVASKAYGVSATRPDHNAAGDSLAWILQANYPDLLIAANQWIEKHHASRRAKRLAHSYGPDGYLGKAYAKATPKGLSPYDQLIQKATETSTWDWRLVAALVYQESRFKPQVTSPQGAYGLMQFTPAAADFFGIPHQATPEVQIRAGIKYLHWLDAQFAKEGIPAENRTEFVLAAYNAGLGRILQARKRAVTEGKSPNVWVNNVALCINTNSRQQATPQQQLAYGHGETCDYVREILDRYNHYRNIIN